MSKLDLDDYEVFFLDMDGVIVMSGRPIPGAVESVNRLKSYGEVYVLSNNSTRTRERFAENLFDLGVDLPPERVVNSAFVLAEYLLEKRGPSSVFTVGEEGLDQELEEVGHDVVVPEESEVLAVGMDRELTYDELDRALTGLAKGATFFATNSDGTFPTPDGESPGAGACVGAIKGMGFEPKRIVGKPSRIAAEIALEAAGKPEPGDCLVIGDRLETDIRLAERANMDSVLILSGVETTDSLRESELKPTYVFEELSDLFS
ncbi:MAG: HAD-IIA family hydrolase [Candidatus Acetothermia bacterium]